MLTSLLSVSSGDSTAFDIEELAGTIESVYSNEVLEISEETVVENQIIQNELVGVNNRLDVLIMFVLAFFIWAVIRAVYKFFDSMF